MVLTKKCLMQQMRERTLDLAEDNNNDEYDSKDLEAISAGSNDLLWRFALFDLECDDSVEDKRSLDYVQVDRAVGLLLRTLRWRKQFGIHQYKESDIPREFYESKFFSYTLHREDKRFLVFIRACKYRNISLAVRALMIKCIVCEFEKIVGQFEEQFENGISDLRMVVILDSSNMKYHSLDVAFMIEAVDILAKHFPSAIEEFWLFNTPWFVRPIVPLFFKSIHSAFARRCRQMNLDDAIASLGKHMLPSFLGGDCPIEPYMQVPEQSTKLDHFAEKNILNKDDITKLKQHFKSTIET